MAGTLALLDMPGAWKRFIPHMARFKDVATAARKTGISVTEARKALKDERVQADLARKEALVEREQARLDAKQRQLDGDLLDGELRKLVTLPEKTHGHVKLNAIRFAYERVGMYRDGAFYIAPTPNDGPKDDEESSAQAPTMYRAFQQTTTTHEVRELHVPIQTAKSSRVGDATPKPPVVPVSRPRRQIIEAV